MPNPQNNALGSEGTLESTCHPKHQFNDENKCLVSIKKYFSSDGFKTSVTPTTFFGTFRLTIKNTETAIPSECYQYVEGVGIQFVSGLNGMFVLK